jgi:hypothetical protein
MRTPAAGRLLAKTLAVAAVELVDHQATSQAVRR